MVLVQAEGLQPECSDLGHEHGPHCEVVSAHIMCGLDWLLVDCHTPVCMWANAKCRCSIAQRSTAQRALAQA
jgi:hypothetical protein